MGVLHIILKLGHPKIISTQISEMSFVGMYHYYTDKILSQLAAVLLHIIDILLMWIVVHLFPSHVEHLHTFSEKVLIFVIGGGKGSNQRMPYII
jgi:hypothetical protein